jgi:hypothetical protein
MKKPGVNGVKEVTKRFEGLKAGLASRVGDVLAKNAETVRAQVVSDINRQKPNPEHVVPKGAKGRKLHVPSPPGGPPNSDTGRLTASYTTELKHEGSRLSAAIVAGAIYAKWLEFGTARMEPRPHLLPRFRQRLPLFRKQLKGALKAGIGEKTR